MSELQVSGVMVRITAPHFCAGLVIGKCAAPIIRYMRDWPIERVRRYCAARGWRIEVVP